MPSVRVFYLFALSTLLGVVGVVVPPLAAVALGLPALILAALGFDRWRLRQVPLAGVRFELALYPNQRHSLQTFETAAQQDFFRRLTDFFDHHLAPAR
jgi:hypothetical protein